MEKIKEKVLACFYENTYILLVKVLPLTLFKLLLAAYRNPPTIL
jgi:hypothetical protein